MKYELLPCPFCGGVNTQLKRNEMWMGGLRPNQLLSVDIRHWCNYDRLTPFLSIRGVDEEQAVLRWNFRVNTP